MHKLAALNEDWLAVGVGLTLVFLVYLGVLFGVPW